MDVLAKDVTSELVSLINIITYGLGGANGVFAASESVEYHEFKNYVASRNFSKEFPGVWGFGFIELVKKDKIKDFLKRVRVQGQPDFEIKSDYKFPELFVTRYLEPEEPNRVAIGYDIGSEPNRRKAAELAMLTGVPVLSKRVQLLQDARSEAGFLYLRPVYKKNSLINTPEERRQNLLGWVYAPFTLERILSPIMSRYGKLMSLEVYEGPNIDAQAQIFADRMGDVSKGWERQIPIEIGQQLWTVVVQPRKELFIANASRYLPVGVFLIGILISLVASVTAWVYIDSRERTLHSKLREGEKFIQGILDSANFSIIVTDPKGLIRVFNKAASRMLGYSAEEIIGNESLAIIHDADEIAARAPAISQTLNREIVDDFEVLVAESRESDAVEKEWTYIRKDKSRFPVALSVTSMRDDAGSIVAFMGIASDISERKQAELKLLEQTEELSRAKEAALEAAHAKSQFLANMSHEIRTPLTSIIGYSESLIVDKRSPEEAQLALETIMKNGNHLLGVINDILDISKIEAGKLDVELIPTDLCDLISDVSNLMLLKAQEKGLSLGFDYAFPIPARISTDPTRLKQILINLVGNAVKFTSFGGVKISLCYRQELQQLEFAVTDTGPGMSQEDKSKLFQAFSQADTSITRKFGGTGLGLVISGELARRLGGELKVESTLGIGSTFKFTIATGAIAETDLMYAAQPTSAKAASSRVGSQIPQLRGRVLVAEDGPDNRELISFILSQTGVEFKIVENGALAVYELGHHSFDLVLMDVQMPVMDGYTATAQIRAQGLQVPIVALTANAMKSDVQIAYAAGCSDFLSKPFSRASLFALLSKFLAPADSKSPADAVVLSAHTRNLVNEDPRMLDIILSILKNLPTRYEALSVALQRREFGETAMLAHSLRGATSTLGFHQIAEAAGHIETAAELKDFEAAREFTDKLKGMIENAQDLNEALKGANL